MSSEDGIRGVLVGHGRLAEGLLDAVEEIAGKRGAIVAVNNEGLTPEALETRLAELCRERSSIIFVDLPSGSCAFAARRLQHRQDRVAVVCGVNLPLLLDFVFHRELSLAELVERLRTHQGITIEHDTEDDEDADRSVQSG